MTKYRVYDDRTNETKFESDDNYDCVMYIDGNYDELHPDFEHIWIEKV